MIVARNIATAPTEFRLERAANFPVLVASQIGRAAKG